MKAIGVDNTQGGVSKELVVGKEVFVAIESVTYVDADGKPTSKDNGDPKTFASRKRYYKVLDRDTPPAIDVSALERSILDNKPKVAPPPVQEAGEDAPF
jgi:hypothetical protein